MSKDETLKLALEALRLYQRTLAPVATQFKGVAAVAAIEQALAAPVVHRDGHWCMDLTCKKCYSADFRLKHTIPLAQPAVPDAITDNSESPDYREGWNDCRQAMMEMMK